MRVLYDHQAFSMFRYGGIARYYSELMYRLPLEPDIHCTAGCIFNKCAYHRKSQSIMSRFLMHLFERYSNRSIFRVNRIRSRRLALKGSFDIIHPTYYRPNILKIAGNSKIVVSFYDMIHEIQPHLHPNSHAVTKQKKVLLEKADHIIAISNAVKNDIMAIFGVPSDKISVTHLGGNWGKLFSAPVQRSRDYILYVGQRKNYKNFSSFLQSITPISKKRQLPIICAGGLPFSSEENALIQQLCLQNRIIHIRNASDDRLFQLYANAMLFVFPSLYEGFGIPLIEAMSAGCPTAISDIPVFREIADDAAIYFDPYSPEHMREAIERTIANSRLRKMLQEKGMQRAKNFTWEATARQTAAVYRYVLDSFSE
jgi:glycosyltransferase involved in cell wall biosynthesis